VIMALICSWNPIRIGLFVSSVASLVELQSTGPFCLGSICYSCCNLAKAVANLKESELLLNNLRLVLVVAWRRSSMSTFSTCMICMYDLYIATGASHFHQ
jgi:hypothetical protein